MGHQLNGEKVGLYASNRGDIVSAERMLRAAWQLDETNQVILFSLARCLYAQRKYKQVAALYADFKKKSLVPIDDSIVFVTMKSAFQSQDSCLHRECLAELHQRHPRDPEVCAQLSALYLAEQRWDEAQAVLEEALRFHPSDPGLLTNLAIIHSELGHYEKAGYCYRAVVHATPKQFLGHFNLAMFLMLLGRNEEAKTSLNKCLQIVPNAPEARRALAKISNDSPTKDSLAWFYSCVGEGSYRNAKECLLRIKSMITPFEFMAAAADLSREDHQELLIDSEFDLSSVIAIKQLLQAGDPLLECLITELKQNKTLVKDRAGKPTVSGLQSHEVLAHCKSDSMQELREKILIGIQEYTLARKSSPWLQRLAASSKANLSGWGVVLRDCGYQKRHVHPEGIVSGVVYLQTPHSTSSTTTREGNLVFSLGETLEVAPATGTIVIFPSYLPHETVAIHGSEERICIAFNVS